uniref:Venom peptide Pcs9.1 n=1 Tax=Purpuraturris cristata TaxID=3251896 RepID=A0A976LY15_9CAEN|nr:venom peptide precursor Pcs9.1 [Turris cristata]
MRFNILLIVALLLILHMSLNATYGGQAPWKRSAMRKARRHGIIMPRDACESNLETCTSLECMTELQTQTASPACNNACSNYTSNC